MDRYTSGVVARISPEAPIPVLKLTDRTARLGNAGFVAANLRAMGAAVTILDVIGEDSSGQFLRNMLTDCGVMITDILTDPTDPSRPTIVKERFLGSVQVLKRAMQQLLRVDQETAHPLSRTLEDALIAGALDEITTVDAVLVCDINKGTLTPRVLSVLVGAARSQNIPILVDPRLDRDFSIYFGATAIIPNRYETQLARNRYALSDFGYGSGRGICLSEQLELDACLITLDRDGMHPTERADRRTLIRTAPVAVSDVTGASEVVLSTFGYFAGGRIQLSGRSTARTPGRGEWRSAAWCRRDLTRGPVAGVL